ncbi:MAG: hypothetical protein ACR2MG_07180 [Pyrinomonadaceae bacterium]
MEILYEYESTFYTDGRSEKLVCQGRKDFIEMFIIQKEFDELFGGFILSKNIESGEEFIGVWGRRKCQRFRRILRERGAEFKLLKDKVPEFRRIITSG